MPYSILNKVQRLYIVYFFEFGKGTQVHLVYNNFYLQSR